MTTFLLNDTLVRTDVPKGMSLLNFIRNEAGLKGTKSGCKEGDCGACTVLEGTLQDGKVIYKSIVSCLTPLGNVHGKHIVTVEGLNNNELTPVQQVMVDNAATQCGFCTPGFVVSFTGYSLSAKAGNPEEAIASVAGNICRCTGYKSIEKAAFILADILKNKDTKQSLEWLIKNRFVPEYFKEVKAKLETIKPDEKILSAPDKQIAGGTDLMVQQPEMITISALEFLSLNDDLKQIYKNGNTLIVGGAVTVNQLLENKDFSRAFPKAKSWFKLISSEQIRNTATLAGNIVNASPIGDMSIFFLALDAVLVLEKNNNSRKVALKEFFIDYKKIDKEDNEIIKSVEFNLLTEYDRFNFEKVSKRIHLDIASVNTAIFLKTKENIIIKALLSAGGVAPVPKFLYQTSDFLSGKKLTPELLAGAQSVMEKEVSPIDDIRGSEYYKKLLLKQLLTAHFMEIFPEIFNEKVLLKTIV